MEAAQKKGKEEGLMAPHQHQKSATELRALVVDDDRHVRMIHQRLLSKVGVKNEAVENGKEAVNIHCNGQSFDLIFMDKEMPVMCGIEATKKLRSMGICSKIVGVSSRSMEAEIQEFMEAGLDEYLVKPLTIDMLSSILDQCKVHSIKC